MKNVFKLKFNKKKKDKKGKGSIHNSSTKRRRGKIRRRASFVSTPIHTKRPVGRTGSIAKRKPQYVVDPATQRLVELHTRPTLDASTSKPVLRPPPGNDEPGNRVRRNSSHSTSSSRHDPLDKLDGHARPRTHEDMNEWMNWRVKVNDQLASYVLKDVSDLQENIPMGSFPKTMTNESLSAILHHAFHEEEHKTSLDKLSYMIYGIPRVCRSHINSSEPDVDGETEDEQPKRALSSKKLRRIPFEDAADVPRPSSPAAPVSLATCDTGGYSVIDRSSSPALTGGWDPNSDFLSSGQPFLRIPEPGYDSPRSVSPNAFAASPPRGSVHTSRSITPVGGGGRGGRPPIAGAVPTILSGLSIHQIPKLRPTQPRSPGTGLIHADMPMFARPQAALPNPVLLGKQRPPMDPLLQELARVRLNPTPPKQNPIFEDNSPPRLSAGGEWAPFHALRPVKPVSSTLPRPSTSPQLESKPTLRPVATLPRDVSSSQPDFLDYQLKPVQRQASPGATASRSSLVPPPPPPPPPLPTVPITGHGGCLPRTFPKPR